MQTHSVTTELIAARPGPRILRHIDVCNKLGVGPSTLFSMISDGRFPKPFIIVPGGRAVGWLESDVDAWIVNRRSDTKEHVK